MAKIKGTEVQRQHGAMSSVHIYFAERDVCEGRRTGGSGIIAN